MNDSHKKDDDDYDYGWWCIWCMIELRWSMHHYAERVCPSPHQYGHHILLQLLPIPRPAIWVVSSIYCVTHRSTNCPQVLHTPYAIHHTVSDSVSHAWMIIGVTAHSDVWDTVVAACADQSKWYHIIHPLIVVFKTIPITLACVMWIDDLQSVRRVIDGMKRAGLPRSIACDAALLRVYPRASLHDECNALWATLEQYVHSSHCIMMK